MRVIINEEQLIKCIFEELGVSDEWLKVSDKTIDLITNDINKQAIVNGTVSGMVELNNFSFIGDLKVNYSCFFVDTINQLKNLSKKISLGALALINKSYIANNMLYGVQININIMTSSPP